MRTLKDLTTKELEKVFEVNSKLEEKVFDDIQYLGMIKNS